MIPNLPTLNVTGDIPTPIVDSALVKVPSSSTNSFAQSSGYSILFITDGPAYFGASDMTRTTASLFPAGTYPFTFQDGELLYVLSSVTGTTVHIQRLGQGFKATGSSGGSGGSGGGGGFGGGGFGS